MTLSFSTALNNRPTYFVEKIWAGLKVSLREQERFFNSCGDYKPWQYDFNCNAFYESKLHTIRKDQHNRWKQAMDIHPVIFNRSPKRLQFAPTIKCVSTQRISIKWKDLHKVTECNFSGHISDYIEIIVDQRNLEENEIWELIHNDGLSVIDFLAHFNDDFEGKIIHWSQLKY